MATIPEGRPSRRCNQSVLIELAYPLAGSPRFFLWPQVRSLSNMLVQTGLVRPSLHKGSLAVHPKDQRSAAVFVADRATSPMCERELGFSNLTLLALVT